MGTPSTRKAYVIELNEFNLDLLARAADRLGLKTLQRILSWQRGTTIADQDVEHQGLDPWVQWVSVHAETPSKAHGVIRLGDVPRLQVPQIWERLSQQGVSTGVWGVMNGSRGNAPHARFFFADPWTFSEQPYPAELARFLALPAYYAKNYLSLRPGELLSSGLRTAGYILRNVPFPALVKDGWFLLKNFWRTPTDSCFLFAAFELISARLFQKFRDRHQPDVCFAFFNLIAHFQHHHWEAGRADDWRTDAIFRCTDRILSIVLARAKPEDLVLVLNGLSQRNVQHEDNFCYRQIDPAGFLARIGIRPLRVEPCMTSEAHVFFATQAERDAALQRLAGARIQGQPAFYVEADPHDATKLFYQIAFWDAAPPDAVLEVGGERRPFFSEFAVHAKRTGAHVKEGVYFINEPLLPEAVENDRVLSFLWPVQHAA